MRLVGDPTLVYHAIAHDPLLAEIKPMVNELFQQNEACLPQFKRFEG